MTSGATASLTWAASGAPFPGELRSGDAYLVAPRASGTLLAVVDGLGHGREAFEAASSAVAALAGMADSPLISLFTRCHAALGRARGVVMTAAAVGEDGVMEWLGVGNVDALVLRAPPHGGHDHILLRSGIVGSDPLPTLRPATLALGPGDVLIMVTDGIREEFADALVPALAPTELAHRILTEHARAYDDALVLVARFEGGPP